LEWAQKLDYHFRQLALEITVSFTGKMVDARFLRLAGEKLIDREQICYGGA
jgi:hypothetical protein